MFRLNEWIYSRTRQNLFSLHPLRFSAYVLSTCLFIIHISLARSLAFAQYSNITIKLSRDISIHGWDKTTSGFGKWTAAILELYFRFRFWRVCCHRHAILDLPAKFRSNRTIVGGVMTSYRFFKMAAIESEIYIRVVGLRWYLFKKVEMYLHAKFWYRCA